MPKTQTFIIKGKDLPEVIEEFATKLSEKLLFHEETGKHVLSTYEDDKEKTVFTTRYIAALIDYHVAVMAGRISNFNYGTKTNDPEAISDRSATGS